MIEIYCIKIIELLSSIIGVIGSFILSQGTYGFEPIPSVLSPPVNDISKRNKNRKIKQQWAGYLLLAAFILQAISIVISFPAINNWIMSLDYSAIPASLER